MVGTIGILIGIVVLILSVILHEVMHGYMADRLGDPTARVQGRLTLNPIPHIDPIGSLLLPALLILSGSTFLIGWAKPVPYDPNNLRDKRFGEAKVAFAGPGTNILLAIIFGLIVRFGIGILPPAFLSVAALVTLVNIVLAIFNLIPVPPLDGSKILFGFLPYRFRNIRNFLEQYWFVAIIIVIFLFWYAFTPVFIFLFTLLTGVGPGFALM